MSYNKFIDVGRLSNLPTGMSELFFNTCIYNITGVEESIGYDYYTVGTTQHLNNVSNVGALFSLTNQWI